MVLSEIDFKLLLQMTDEIRQSLNYKDEYKRKQMQKVKSKKITKTQRIILKLYEEGYTKTEISYKLNIPRSTISRIIIDKENNLLC